MVFHLNIRPFELFGMIMNKLQESPDIVSQKPVPGLHRILDVRELTENTFLLRFERLGLQFRAGQYITLGLPGARQHREYSIYSGEEDDHLEVLIREIPDGDISPQLKTIRAGQFVEVNGPLGFMKVDREKLASGKFVLIASGTGIAPFRSFIRSHPEMDYLLLHGVRYGKEAYDRGEYDPDRYVRCTSRDEEGDFKGHVTSYLDRMKIDKDMVFYVCGNSSMVYEVYSRLDSRGIESRNIHSEVYF